MRDSKVGDPAGMPNPDRVRIAGLALARRGHARTSASAQRRLFGARPG